MGSSEPLVESGRAHEMPGMVADAGLAIDHAHAVYKNANAFWSDKPSERDALVLDKWGHRLITTHFSDTDGQGNVHWLPMKGIVDWDAVSRAYPTSHQGPIMIEAVPQDRALPPTEFLADAYETAIKLREKLVSLPNCRE